MWILWRSCRSSITESIKGEIEQCFAQPDLMIGRQMVFKGFLKSQWFYDSLKLACTLLNEQ